MTGRSSTSAAALVEVATEVAGRLGERIADRAPVDAAWVRGLLLAATPEAGVAGPAPDGATGRLPLQWVVGPLDVRSDPASAVVGLAAAVEGLVCAAAVLDVAREELFTALRGGGARLAGVPFAVDRAGPATRTADLPALAPAAVRSGSAALGLCWVACGRLGALSHRDPQGWEHLPGVLVAEEAGAACELPVPENGHLLTCAAPSLAAALRAAVRAGTGGTQWWTSAPVRGTGSERPAT